MLSKTMQESMNKQLNKELYSSYLYLSMCAYFEDIDLPGHANWMRCQAQEELIHAMKFFDFINEREGRVLVTAVDGPPAEWASPLVAFQNAYEHECFISDCINKLVDQALAESDHMSNSFLQWFVTEQIEEEKSTKTVAQRLKLAGETGPGLFMVDQELAQRVFVYPTAPAGQAGGGQ